MELNSLRPNWTVEDLAATGRIIYEAVPIDWRPDWAGSILLFAASEDFLCDELAGIVDLSIDEKKWVEAHDAFQRIRQLTLQNEEFGKIESHQQFVLDIGETAAKVIYNASGGAAPFDYDAGWRMAPRVKKLAEFVGDQGFEDQCWRLLIRSESC